MEGKTAITNAMLHYVALPLGPLIGMRSVVATPIGCAEVSRIMRAMHSYDADKTTGVNILYL